MTLYQRNIIVGNILGDGYLHFDGYKGTSFEIRQQQSHKDYIWWLFRQLSSMCNRKPYLRQDNHQWRLYTRYLPELTKLQQIFYPEGKKKVPSAINKLLTHPISLAVWFMDDGTKDQREKSHKAFHLITNSFDKFDNELLVNALNKNFDIEAKIHSTKIRKKQYFRLYIGANSREKFLNIIQPYILQSFQYKLLNLS